MTINWQPVTVELERWSSAGMIARLWVRDDDAIEPTAALDALLDLSAHHDVPVLLAVIPAGATDALAKRLEDVDHIAPAIHGWAHINHAGEGEKSQELGAHRASEIVLGELVRGFSRLTDLFADRLVPILVPPWNRIDPTLVSDLPRYGYRGLSAFGRKSLAEGVAGLSELNTHVDLIDWRGTRGCRDHAELVECIAAELAASRESGGTPVGILSHHLVHDAGVTIFLNELFELVARHPAARWVSTKELLA